VVDEVSDSPIGRGQPINVNSADVQIKSARAVRLDISTGDIKTQEIDLLAEVARSTSAQTKTLEKTFGEIKGGLSDSDINKITEAIKSGMIAAGTSATAAGGEGAVHPGTASISQADVRATVKGFQIVSETLNKYTDSLDILNRTTKETDARLAEPTIKLKDSSKAEEALREEVENAKGAFSEFHKDMVSFIKSGATVQLRRNFENLATSMFRFGETLTDVRGSFRNVSQDFKKYDALLKSGQVNLDDFITQIGSTVQGTLSLDHTIDAMEKAMQSGAVTPFATLGSTLTEVRQNLFDFREGLATEGFNWASALDTTEFSAAAIELVGIERRASLQADINNIDTRRNVAEQLRTMQSIGFMTGKSLDQLVEINRKTAEELTELEALGAVSQTTRQNTQSFMNFLKAQGAGGEAIANIIGKSLRYGERGLAVAMSEDATLRTLFQQNPEFREVFNRLTSGRAVGLQEAAAPLQQIQQRGGITLPDVRAFKGIGIDQREAGGVAVGINEIFTDFNKRMGKFTDAQEGPLAKADDAIRSIEDVIKQNLPKAATNMLNLVIALGANVIALWANTAALGAGLFGRMFGRGKGGIGAAASTAVAGKGIASKGIQASAAATMAGKGALAGVGMTPGIASTAAKMGLAGSVLKGGGGLLAKALPGLGTAISGGLAVSDFMEGDMLGGVGHSAAAIASLFPGIGTAIAFAIEGGLLAREITGEDAPEMKPGAGPTTAAIPKAPGTSSGGKGMIQLMQQEITVLQTMLSVMVTGNEISQDIRNRISLGAGPVVEGPNPGGRAPAGRTRSRDNAPFADRLASSGKRVTDGFLVS